MAVKKGTFPVIPRKIVFEPKWAADGTFLGCDISMTAETYVEALGKKTDVGQIKPYFRPAADMTQMELATYALLAETFDSKAVAELGCEKL